MKRQVFAPGLAGMLAALALVWPAAAPGQSVVLTPLPSVGVHGAPVGTDLIPVQSPSWPHLQSMTAADLLSYIRSAISFTGDCSASSGALTCVKTAGVAFGYFATGTDASSLTGTVSVNRFNSGTSASSSTYLNGAGQWTTPASSTGTVTSVSLTMPAEFSVSGSPVTASGGFTVSRANQTANLVMAGPSTGSPAAPTFRALVGADLPNPSSSTLGGTQSKAAVSHNFMTSISTSGVPALAQPAVADISDGSSGSGAICLVTSCAMTSPNLGTPSAVNLTNATALPASAMPANTKIGAIATSFGDTLGSALTAGSIVYGTIPFACTISAWNMTLDAGTATIDVWKIATGTAVPTVSNTIDASALPAISTGTAIHSTTLTGWTTSVSANDIFGFKLNAVSTAKYVSITLECDR